MMKYKDIMGYSKKKKTIKKEVVEPTPKPTVLDDLKEELGYGVVKEGPAYEYSSHIKRIEKLYDAYGAAVGDFETLLKKKGLKGASMGIANAYKNLVFKFHKLFGKIVRKLM